MHFRKKLAAVLEPETAYNLLRSHISTRLKKNRLVLKLTKPVELTELQREIILKQANAVYACMSPEEGIVIIDEVEFEVSEKALRPLEESKGEVIEIPEGIWGEIRKSFISESREGTGIDKSWLSRLEAEVDEKERFLKLKAPSAFFRDWIDRNYLHKIRKYALGKDYRVWEVMLC
jgi:hypothetical protein